MILPLPVKLGTDEEGVQFIDLSGYPDFFKDLRAGFSAPQTMGIESRFWSWPGAANPLKIQLVGNFEASFVPTIEDFPRLDQRFRLAPDIWSQLPGYQDHGFAVFKLKSGNAKVHPMAFSFPRRDPKVLFFPTVHIHDGKVHAKAEFDHMLYYQPSEQHSLAVRDWRESDGLADTFMKVDESRGVILASQPCYQKPMHGLLPNRDTFVSIAA